VAEDPRHAVWRAEFESLGETGVRMIDGGGSQVVPDDRVRFSKVWLAERDSAKRDDREKQTLALAKEANDIARAAQRWAMYAAIAAVIALIVSIAQSRT
jgi:hypothetical protein